jgi:hypothetical protein
LTIQSDRKVEAYWGDFCRDECRARRIPLHSGSSDRSRSAPYRPGKRNYVPVMIIALAASLVLGQHLMTLLTMDDQS